MTPPPLPAADEPHRRAERARLEIARLAIDPDRPLPEVFRRVTEIAADTLDVERVGIWLLTADGEALRCADLFERSKRDHSEGVTLQVADFPEYVKAVSARGALPSELALTDPRTVELRDAYLIPLGITSILDAPILRNGAMIGVVCHEHVGPPREWTTEDRDFAMSVAELVTNKIKAAELLLTKSALRQQATQQAEADRMATVGRLAAGLAHDFKNLLTVVMGNAGLIARNSSLPPDVLNRAAMIVEAAERGSALVREILDFGRDPAGHPQVVNVPAALADVAAMLRSATGADHPITITSDPGTGRVLIDRGQLERAVLNLVINARDAMPRGGPICVHVAVEHTTPNGGPLGAYVRIDVQDSGTGISPADRERIFDPYFTTKPMGKGTGLGLAVVRRVIERAGGFVRVDSTSGAGTTFRLFLPRVAGEG